MGIGTKSMTGTLRTAYRWGRRRSSSMIFERRYRVHTGGRIDLDAYGLADEDRGYYIASNWRNLRVALRGQPIGASDVFLDLGSGMGRMVLEAARFPFGRVIGVELAEDLHRIAQANVASYRGRLRCRDIELVRSDVLDYEIPDDLTYVYMFSPFRGAVFAATLEKILASLDRHPRRLRLIYANPVEDYQLVATGRVRTVGEIGIGRGAPTLARTIRLYEFTAGSSHVTDVPSTSKEHR